ncbi:hypothetical protein ACSBR2_020882 [Camellia fascicularis]
MKKTNTPFTFHFLSLFPIILPLLRAASAAAAAESPVLDTTGQSLRTDLYYFILPAARGGYGGGGLTLSAGHNATSTCPLDVVQEQLDYGLPATFSPINLTKGVVRVSTDLNIVSSPRAYSVCVESNVWRLDSFDESTGKYFVTTGGVKGNPSRRTLRNWFKIERYEDFYKLAFCPNVCGVAEMCKVLCKDVGVYVDRIGTRRLVLSDVPFKVMFKKV